MADVTRLEQFLNHIAHPDEPVPAPQTRMEHNLLEIAENKGGGGGLPDYSEASEGDVLSIDSNGDPAWATPSGGGGIVVLPYEIGVSFNELKAIVDGGTLPVIFNSISETYYEFFVLSSLAVVDISGGEGELQYEAVFGMAGGVDASISYTASTPTEPLVKY